MKVSTIKKKQWKEVNMFIFGVDNWGGKEGRGMGLCFELFLQPFYVFFIEYIFFNLKAKK